MFTTEDLYRDIHHRRSEKDPSLPMPVFATLTSNVTQHLLLFPRSRQREANARPEAELVDAEAARKLAIGGLRVLVSSTFEAPGTDLSQLHHCLRDTLSASELRIESIFLGPPTVLMISMPYRFFEAIKYNKLCQFVAYISSANLVHVYDEAVFISAPPHLETRQDLEEMLEAAEQLKALKSGIPAHPTASISSAASACNPMTGLLSPAGWLDGHRSKLKSTRRSKHRTGSSAGGMAQNRKRPTPAATPAARQSPRKNLSTGDKIPCIFSFVGCTSSFSSKSNWKRHVNSTHLRLQHYCCQYCDAEGKMNIFNRKDPFTQHLHRQHASTMVERGSLSRKDWELRVRKIYLSCLVERQPPKSLVCPKPECNTEFTDRLTWDD